MDQEKLRLTQIQVASGVSSAMTNLKYRTATFLIIGNAAGLGVVVSLAKDFMAKIPIPNFFGAVVGFLAGTMISSTVIIFAYLNEAKAQEMFSRAVFDKSVGMDELQRAGRWTRATANDQLFMITSSLLFLFAISFLTVPFFAR